MIAYIIRRYGLDEPVHVQYWKWMMGTEDPETGETVAGIFRVFTHGS